MRGQRARAAILDRLGASAGQLPSDACAVLDRIGDDPLEWSAIAVDLFEKGEDKASRQALDAVAALMKFALDTTSRQHPCREHYLGCYGVALELLAERFGDLDVVAEAEAVLLPEVEQRAANDSFRHRIFHSLGRMAVAHTLHSPSADATRAVIRARLRMLSGMPPGHPDRPEMMSRLGMAYHDLFHEEDDNDAVAEAVRWTREALAEARDDHPALGQILYSVSTALRHQCELTPNPDLLREAISISRAAASRLPDWDLRSDTAQLLFSLYEHAADDAALDESIELFGGWAADATGTDSGLAHGKLGNALRARYQRTGDPDDLAEAVRTMRHAVQTVPVGHPSYTVLASNLSAVLSLADNRVSDETVHGEAVRIGRTAAGNDDLLALNNLGTTLIGRFTQTGDSRALREAIDTLERAVRATPSKDPFLASRLSNLGEALYYSFLRTGDPRELDRAIDLGRQAIAAAAGRDPGRAGYLSRLSVRLHRKYNETDDLTVLTEAAARARDAIAALRASDPDRPVLVSAAIHALRSLFHATTRPEVLEEAIELGRAELAALPAGHGGRTELLAAFSAALQRRYFDFGDRAAGQEASRLLLAASLTPASSINQILYTRAAALFYISEREWETAANAMAHAVKLLPRLASRRLVRADQERQLGTAAGVVHDACACALNAGDPERALALLEHGRGVLFAQALENRDELTELREQRPDLADEVAQIRERLANWSTGNAADADEQHALTVRWDQLTTDIRALPGFAHFLLPPPADELLAAATDGPVVLFSISDFRSDALVLTPGGVEVVRLPGVTPEEIRRRATEFQADANSVTETLEWLWDNVTGPVLEHVGLHGPAGDRWPRLWWCPTGPLSFLPLHAAGYHQPSSEGPPKTVMDRVVSSYTPTVRALLHARRRPGFSADVNALVVTMPNTAATPDLPGVAHEAGILADNLPRRPTVLREADAVRDRVLAELPRHNWAHFACHGFSDPGDPSASHLLLDDHATKPLTILDISRLHLENADLACLSACSTAQVGTTLTDETIHLAAAFNLAGYRHVIATLWPVRDRPAARFTQTVYGTVTAEGAESTAYAVHAATLEARKRYPQHPHVWAAHIHTGA
ncbi:CHAT domain-containing protein [Kibdelosporangium aridum]|nr:CHAT domain-containing protein [Kibdelosporangium aridum]